VRDVHVFPLTGFADGTIVRHDSVSNEGGSGSVSVEKLETLEIRVKKMLDLIVELRREKSNLEQELESARERLAKQQELSENWEEERGAIRTRIEKVLGELDFLERSPD
jgi:chromosome segregation ATPase